MPNSVDWSRGREITLGMPKNYVALGVVGHAGETPAFARIEDDAVLVEVTLVPSGDEITARLSWDAADGGGAFVPVELGQKVVVTFPAGDASFPILSGRVNDRDWPFPDTVAGVSTKAPGDGKGAPLFGFLRTPEGVLYALETGEGGDLLLTSGASIQLSVGAGEQVLLGGRTHIGSGVGFSKPPVGETVGASGSSNPGQQGEPFRPAVNTNTSLATGVPVAPLTRAGEPLPADGVVRIKDAVESNSTTDARFWTWIDGFVQTFLVAWVTVPQDGGAALKAALSAYITASPVPNKITSKPVEGSRNTVGDE